ncbi:MAG: ribosome biogenesis GTPase Der [Acidimicrobiia bacterium]|nr:ribosome biogenesis GTPase Der [Acidimicrobiia bacterium]
MSQMPIVAVVGRPNVGKSTLVNRIVGRRVAVVEAKPGVTRDRREFRAEWLDRPFLLIDTGGWELTPAGELTQNIRAQTEAALAGADAVLFVTDATGTVTDDDTGVAEMLRRADIPVILVANKSDNPQADQDTGHLYRLGIGDPMPVSALHGRGTGDLLERLFTLLPDMEVTESPGVASLAIIGRPNVGKSTLLNRMLGEDRVLVSETPGTTRDPIDAIVEMDGESFRVVDTAGIRRPPKWGDGADYYAVLRAKGVLAESDVALLMIDGVEGATHQDQRLAEEIAEAGTGLVVLLNKWDVATREERDWCRDSVADRLGFVGWAPVLTLSAKTGSKIKRIGGAVRLSLESLDQRIPTGELNRLIRRWQEAHPPPVRKGRRPKILYAVHAGRRPPQIVLFIAGGELGEDYLRYLENRLRHEYDFTGAPIRFRARQRAGSRG